MITDPAAFAEAHFGITLKRATTNGEYSGPCPFCKEGDDRFHVWQEGNYWCRVCDSRGWLDNLDGAQQPSREEIMEARIRQLERKQAEHDKRLSALERMAHSQDHILYHKALDRNDQAIEWWLAQGINMESIYRYTLGYCPRCPTDKDKRPSYTIPVFHRQKLLNIRHRLASAPNGDKYRPHLAGLGNQLFNADVLDWYDDVVVVEGAKKSIAISQHGFNSVAVMGKRAFKREWLGWFDKVKQVRVALDPDATESAYRLAQMFGDRGRVAIFPTKPDDFFSVYGGTAEDFANVLRLARPV